MNFHHSVQVHESSQTSAARFEARQLAERAGFDEADQHRAGLVATELATNLLKHASGGGEVLMRIGGAGTTEIEIISLDRGPGIPDIARSMLDGHSTAGSPGTGLGAVRRTADDFDIFSNARGTIVLARLRSRGAARRLPGEFLVSAISVAMPGEPVCGDAWCVREYRGGLWVMMADGLGHGVLAHEASEAVVTAFEREPFGTTTTGALESIHLAIRHTRGAAVAIADVSVSQGVLRFSGIGNISAAVCADGRIRQAVSTNGTLGHIARYFREYTYPMEQGATLVMHSDGLSARWTLEPYPGIRLHDPAVLAATLYRDFSRSRDDATVLVARRAA